MSRIAAYSSVDVSIVIMNHNQGVFLERCIRSCLAQTFPGRFHQVLVVDAASRDFSREVIHSYDKQVIPVLLEEPSSGLDEAAAAGIRRANGRFLVHVRAQDFLSDYMILFQTVWLYQNQEHDGVSVDSWVVDQRSDAKIKRVSGPDHASPYGAMYRKEVFIKEGAYEPKPHGWFAEGCDRRLVEKYRIGHLPIPFYRYQQEPRAQDPIGTIEAQAKSGG